MAVTPTGPESLPLANLRTLIQASATFVSWAAATGRVHLIGMDDPNALVRPYAIVSFVQDDWHLDRTAVEVGEVGGSLVFHFFASVIVAQTISDQVLSFMNKTGAIIAEMAAVAGDGSGGFNFRRIMRTEGPRLKDEDDYQDEADFITSGYAVTFGGTPSA